MIDEIGLRKDMDRSAKADALLNNSLFNEAFDALRAGYLTAIVSTEMGDVSKRETLYHAVRSLDMLKQHFTSLVSTGNLAQRELSDAGLI